MAGLLNLMVIIDAAHRSVHLAERRAAALRAAGPGGRVSRRAAFRRSCDPLPVWDYWYLLILPLCLGIAVVWKSVKCRSMADVPREAAVLLLWILGGFAAAAAALVGLIRYIGQ